MKAVSHGQSVSAVAGHALSPLRVARSLYHESIHRGRCLPDGTIEFLGRIDYQVKIRGNRVEVGEVEAVIAALPEVQDSVVIVREDEPGEKRLVAYVVARDRGQSANYLRAKLNEKLPGYMLSASSVLL